MRPRLWRLALRTRTHGSPRGDSHAIRPPRLAPRLNDMEHTPFNTRRGATISLVFALAVIRTSYRSGRSVRGQAVNFPLIHAVDAERRAVGAA
jgi:hypothetical protein